MATNLTSKQIITWKNNVDTAITKNLVTSLKKAEKTAAEKVRKSIDQFAEAAAKIQKLKM